jgi:hypothetical protein
MEAKFNARNNPQPNRTSPQEEKEFISKAKIRLPAEYQRQYEALILKHHDEFSKNN